MPPILKSSLVILLSILFISCFRKEVADGQTAAGTTTASPGTTSKRIMPGACEDCALMFVGIPEHLHSVDTTSGWFEEGQRLIVKGKVFHLDEKTPASDVLLYYYHTDQKGRYAPGPEMPQEVRRHGYLRGWVKTDPDGSYAIYTNRPAQYPDGDIEAHIHVIVKEPDMATPYWIDAWIFDDDPLVTDRIRANLENRGGSGLLTTSLNNGIQVAHHNIVIGLNIPGYPDR